MSSIHQIITSPILLHNRDGRITVVLYISVVILSNTIVGIRAYLNANIYYLIVSVFIKQKT